VVMPCLSNQWSSRYSFDSNAHAGRFWESHNGQVLEHSRHATTVAVGVEADRTTVSCYLLVQ
jgi:hypothetical protein